MRLSCANCNAQYEVDATAIPDEGREVRCSACGLTWFQARPEEPLAGMGTANGTLRDAPAEAPPLRRRPVDPAVLDILREEAARESRARGHAASDARESGESGGVAAGPSGEPVPQAIAKTGTATATEAVLIAPDTRVDPMIDVTAPEVAFSSVPGSVAQASCETGSVPVIKPVPEAPMAQDETYDGVAPTRSDDTAPHGRGLPDPADMTSTLAARRAEPPPPHRGGFLGGMAMALVLVGGLVGLYVAAPGLSRNAPAAAPALRAYVTQADAGRAWLQQTTAGWRAAINDLLR